MEIIPVVISWHDNNEETIGFIEDDSIAWLTNDGVLCESLYRMGYFPHKIIELL